jgi:hypothetical protein
MSVIHQDSAEGMNPELELFSLLMTQTNIDKTRHIKSYPTTSISSNNPIEFTLISGEDQVIDLNNMMLYTKSRILNHDGTRVLDSIGTGDQARDNEMFYVFPINYFHGTRFKNIELFINNKLVSHSDNMYAFRSYLECLLSNGLDPKKGQLKMGMFYKDDNFQHDNFHGIQDTERTRGNFGSMRRFVMTNASKSFECFGRLHTDLNSQSRPLPPGTELRLRLHRSDPKFCLQAPNPGQHGYSISIDEAVLFYQVKTVSPGILLAHTHALNTSPYKYPLRKVDLKFFTHATGQQDLSIQNFCTGTLPRKVLVALVRSDAFHGTYGTCPILFEHFNCSSMVMRVNGDPRPYEGLTMDFDNSHCFQALYSLLSANGVLNSDRDINITPDDFMHGFCIYGFDLTPDHKADSSVFYLLKDGTVSLECKLKEASSASITTICYIEYDSVLNIDKDGSIFYNE